MMNSSDNQDKIRDLALQLKSTCDENGQETNFSKSAEIIYKLGLVHFDQRPDKMSLIKCVGLLNAAIVRNPSNVSEIKNKLDEVCQYILQQANACDRTADLIEISRQVKTAINSLRNDTNYMMAELETKLKNCMRGLKAKLSFPQEYNDIRIKSIQKIQNRITAEYKKIMKSISKYCVKIAGPPPCKFAIVGMGSLARKEITPYSDFEHIILLEIQTNYKKNLSYFQWFSVIFHVIVLNLQETIIPNLNIKYFNAKTTDMGDWFFDTCKSGISFDGMMPHACKFPLGRTEPTQTKTWSTELIKPVDKMLKYLSAEISFKNGYHLSDILMESCFVYGCKKIYAEFEKGILSHKKSKSQTERCEEIRNQVKEDLDNTAIRTKLVNLKPNEKLNVKLMFYRSITLFLAAFGKICGAKSSSCFGIINEMAEKRIISLNTKRKLLFAVAIACEIRLKLYMTEESQRNYITPCEYVELYFKQIIRLIDQDLVISYFQITYCLQQEIIKLLGIKQTYIYTNISLLNITICYVLRLDAMMMKLIKKHTDLSSLSSFADEPKRNHLRSKNILISFDQELSLLESELVECRKTPELQPKLFALYDNLWRMASDCISIDETLEFLKRVVEILQRSPLSPDVLNKIRDNEDTDFDSFVGWTNMLIAVCLVALGNFHEALKYMTQANNLFNVHSNESEVTAKFYFLAGNNWIEMKKYDEALSCLQTALGISLSVDVNEYKYSGIDQYEIAMMYTGIGICLLKLHHYTEAQIYLQYAVEMIENNFVNETLDFYHYLAIKPATTYQNLGNCSIKLQNFQKRVQYYLYHAIELTTNGNSDEENDKVLAQLAQTSSLERKKLENLASILHDLGLWYMKQNSFDEALTYLKRSFDFFTNLSEAADIAATRIKILFCYMENYQRDKSVLYTF